jgi:capsular polysaccharide biosynthesis protein
VELRRYFSILKRRVWLVVITVIAGMAGGYATTPRTSVYTAQATIYVGARQLSNGAGNQPNGFVSNDQLTGIERVIQTFAKMIVSEPVAQDALSRTGLQRSAASVVGATAAFPDSGTQLLHIRTRDADPLVAQKLANGMADAFVEKIATFEPSAPPQAGSLPQLPAYVFDRAKLPTSPLPTGLLRRLILGGLFGLLAAGALSFLLEYLDVTIKSATEAERRLELPVLAVIPYDRRLPVTRTPTLSRARARAT